MQHNFNVKGLTEADVLLARKKSGTNSTEEKSHSSWLTAKEIVLEPMFILLVIAAAIYFLLDETKEGLFMVVAILIVAAISFFQDRRSRIALESLKKIATLKAKVLRDGEVRELPAEEIVMSDYIIVEEGALIPADGLVIQCNDFAVNESILTGESFPVTKDAEDKINNYVFQGTIAVSGLGLIQVTAIGKETRFAKIGKTLVDIEEEKTPLQQQINHFVKMMAIIGGIVFLGVWAFNFFTSKNILDSLVKGLTLAMSILPEEIPVAFTTFMALGAWRLMQNGIVVKKIKTVETLGAATVVCVDKTGTITENKMALAEAYVPGEGLFAGISDHTDPRLNKLVEVAMWASEPVPFDPMEQALHQVYGKMFSPDKRIGAVMVHEYPLSGKPPIMTHIFSSNGNTIIAVKGSPERILSQSKLSVEEKNQLTQRWKDMASRGLRVLGVGEGVWEGPYPKDQETFSYTFIGFIGFYDPPKKNIPTVIQNFYDAGIKVKIITGDSPETTNYVANEIKIKGSDEMISGEELMQLPDEQLKHIVLQKNIFVRMFPEAKLRIISALKESKQIVAMTGDGVNDGPALKAAHIGIAMGHQGSEIAKQASALILIDGDLSRMVDAVAMGRKIYINLKRAIQYIISIHIPIVLMVSLPLFLGLKYPFIFTPVHVIFLELIMGPTCSIVYENEPFDQRLMRQAPRKVTSSFFQWHELRISIIQGVIISFVLLVVYSIAVHDGAEESLTRTVVFTTLIIANVFLTLANRSFSESFLKTIQKKNRLMNIVVLISLALLVLILYLPPLQNIFQLVPLSALQLLQCFCAAFLSVIWIEGYKLILRKKEPLLT